MKKIFISALCILSINSYAGFNGLTYHSRANCGNNETITWDWTRNWNLWTISDHYSAITGIFIHSVNSGAQFTWRSAAVCWGEGGSGWKVHGTHWRLYTDRRWYIEQDEWVTDCSIYDGWWDRNK